jgi:WD40 repeat protein
MLLLEGHRAGTSVTSVAFAPDGRTLASTGFDGTVRLWDLQTAACRILAEPGRPRSVAFAPDGQTLAWLHNDGITLWRLATGEAQALRHGGLGLRVRFSPDGLTLAECPGPTIWDLQTGKPLHGRRIEGWWSCSLAFSPDGRTLASSHSVGHPPQKIIRLSDVTTGAEQATLRGHTNFPSDLAFSPLGDTLAAPCGQFLCVWDVTTGRLVCRVKAGRLHFQSAAFTPDGRFLATTGNDRTARLWDTRTWRQHTAYDWDVGPLVSLAVAPDGMRAAAGSKRGKIVVWDLDL